MTPRLADALARARMRGCALREKNDGTLVVVPPQGSPLRPCSINPTRPEAGSALVNLERLLRRLGAVKQRGGGVSPWLMAS